MSISEKIRVYHGDMCSKDHHRYRSWDHCYSFFRECGPTQLRAQRDAAALQLGFYLASWGMYRGSSFLLRHSYTVHQGVIDCLASERLSPLWECDFGSGENDVELIPAVLAAVRSVREAYAPLGQPTDTLVTKILLGTLGCLPACDTYFIAGFKNQRFSYSYLNRPFVGRLLQFCNDHMAELRSEQKRIEHQTGLRYPLMKLVDMYFWQLGFDLDPRDVAAKEVA